MGCGSEIVSVQTVTTEPELTGKIETPIFSSIEHNKNVFAIVSVHYESEIWNYTW